MMSEANHRGITIQRAWECTPIRIAIEDHTIDSFELTSTDEVIYKIPLSAYDLGTAEMVELKIQVDQTFVPAQMPDANSIDQRELGVRVFHTFLEPVE